MLLGRRVVPPHLARLLDEQVAALGELLLQHAALVGVHEVGGEVLDAVVPCAGAPAASSAARRVGRARRRVERRTTRRGRQRDAGAAVERAGIIHHTTASMALAVATRYRGCGAKMLAAYAVRIGRPRSSNATKLTPRSTMSVCCRAATTWPKPMRRIVSDASHDSMRISTATPSSIDARAGTGPVEPIASSGRRARRRRPRRRSRPAATRTRAAGAERASGVAERRPVAARGRATASGRTARSACRAADGRRSAAIESTRHARVARRSEAAVRTRRSSSPARSLGQRDLAVRSRGCRRPAPARTAARRASARTRRPAARRCAKYESPFWTCQLRSASRIACRSSRPAVSAASTCGRAGDRRCDRAPG